MPKYTNIGKHIVLRKEDVFTVIDDLEKNVSTLLSPHTWKKLCAAVQFISKEIQSKDKSWKFIRRLSYSMTLEVVASSPKRIHAKLKTHNDPSGTRLNTNAWYSFVKVCNKCKTKQILRERVVYIASSNKNHVSLKHNEEYPKETDSLDLINAEFENLKL